MFRKVLTALGAAALLITPAMAADPQASAAEFVRSTVGDMLTSPQVIAAVKAQNERHAGLSEADVIELDNRWRAGDAALIDGALSNDLSKMLSELVTSHGGAFSEIFVMDNRGLNVGQSARTSDYWQGDEAKWRQTFLVGPDASHVSDVEEDESTQTFQVQVSLPIVDGGQPIGAITLGVDVEYLD